MRDGEDPTMTLRAMQPLPLLGIACVLVFMSLAAWSAVPSTRALTPTERLRDWMSMKSEITDTSIDQEWQLTITRLPVNTDAYDLVTYLAVQMKTPQQAASAAQYMLTKGRFSEYQERRYDVSVTPWALEPSRGVEFVVSGVDHSKDYDRAHYVHLYTLAFAVENWVVMLEVREAGNAPTLTGAQRALRGYEISSLAEDYALTITGLWLTAPGPVVSTTDTTTSAPPNGGESDTTTTTAPPNDGEGDTTTTTTPPQDTTETTNGTTSTTPPDTQPTGTPWSTTDGHLSLLLPAGASVVGKSVYAFSGITGATLTLYEMGSYTDEKDLIAALEDFASTQQSVSKANFTRVRYDIAGARGLRVAYITMDYVAKHDIERISYCFGTKQQLWRLDVELPGTKDAQPAAITTLLAGITFPEG
jgi:hypothetical protein